MSAFEMDLCGRGCDVEYFRSVISPAISGKVILPCGDITKVEWDKKYGFRLDGFLINLPAPEYNCISFCEQLDLFEVEIVFRGVGYSLDYCTLNQVEEIFYQVCVLKKPLAELPLFGKKPRAGIQDAYYEDIVKRLSKAPISKEDEPTYIMALEYLISIARDITYISKLADFYRDRGFEDLAEKYYNLAAKYK